jgi:hypothetical protein
MLMLLSEEASGLVAHSKWLLSGTPPLDNFADAKSMAKLIGVKLGAEPAYLQNMRQSMLASAV